MSQPRTTYARYSKYENTRPRMIPQHGADQRRDYHGLSPTSRTRDDGSRHHHHNRSADHHHRDRSDDRRDSRRYEVDERRSADRPRSYEEKYYHPGQGSSSRSHHRQRDEVGYSRTEDRYSPSYRRSHQPAARDVVPYSSTNTRFETIQASDVRPTMVLPSTVQPMMIPLDKGNAGYLVVPAPGRSVHVAQPSSHISRALPSTSPGRQAMIVEPKHSTFKRWFGKGETRA